jgi:hypothetical protein
VLTGIQKVLPNVAQNYLFHDWLSERAILVKSIATASNEDDVVNYSLEFLNSIDLPGLPPHNLQLKVGSVIMLQNINQPQLCNSIQLTIKKITE